MIAISGTPAAAQSSSSACGTIVARPNDLLGGANLSRFYAWGGRSDWTRDISKDPVDPNSATWVASMEKENGAAPGIVFEPVVNTVVVTAGQTRVEAPPTAPSAYPKASDPGPFPIPMPPLIQDTGRTNYDIRGDKHLTIIDKDACLLYEMWNANYDPVSNNLVVGSSSVYDLLAGDHQRPYLWGSATVAGVPWSFNAVRYDEVAAGEIRHALTFAARGAWGRPAFTDLASSHQYTMPNRDTLPPFGVRARLKESFDVSGYAPSMQVVLNAMKRYGMVYIDGGQSIDLHAEADDRWVKSEIVQLRSVLFNSDNFDFVQTGPIYNDPMYGRSSAPPSGPSPEIGSFTATPASAPAGTPVTLKWSVSGAASRLRFVTPGVGPVVTDSAIVAPSETTTYTLSVANAYGVTKKTVTVAVTGSCTPGVPAIAIAPASQTLVAGGAASYLVSITNTDSSGCASERLVLSHTLPAAWTGYYTPATLTIAPGGSATATLKVAAPDAAARGEYTLTAAVSGMAGTAAATARAFFVPPQSVALALSSATVVGSRAATGTVTLTNPAPAGGVEVALSASGPAAVPASVVVPEDSVSASFAVSTTSVSSAMQATVSASFAGVSRSAALRIEPPSLQSLFASPSSVAGGSSAELSVVLMTAPVAEDTVVALSSADPALAFPPATVTIPAGASSSPRFAIGTANVRAATVVALTATHGAITKTATLTIQPLALADLSFTPAAVGGGSCATGKVMLNGPAPADVAVALASADPAVASAPAQVMVPAGSSSATFVVATTGVSAPATVAISASLGDTTRTKVLTVNPPSLAYLTLAPSVVVGGTKSGNNSVSLDAPAGADGAIVSLTSADPSLAAVPPAITVPPGGLKSAAFPISTANVASATTVAITASYGSVSKTMVMTLNPVALSSIVLSPASVGGGNATVYNCVRLSGPAGPDGEVVALASADPAVASVPAAVVVPPGAQSAVFTIVSSPVAAPTTVAITATRNGISRTATVAVMPVSIASIQLNPAVVDGGAKTFSNSVMLTAPAGPDGATVTLSSSDPALATLPETVTIAPGATRSPWFTVVTGKVATTTTVSVTAAFGGEWKTATLTLNP